ncbi:esterase [Thioclava sp. SK-1]|uniref:alpha/beta fold hydrolase n=1 Tax=Thioclava sp. SK-1 TaxID=1889770 RepID=UPI0008242516|nr:alpha/beta fold hydrolase [Thioclava sp. SK-1]OCX66755.1 esterase [Thioclava sp. SK-1]
MLNTVSQGSATEQPPLLIVHGLFGSARNWGVIQKRLSSDREVITVDQRNHGDSGWTETHSYADMASDLAEVIDAHGGQMDVLGHSMGGKAAMYLALTQPEKIGKLIVADIAPVTYRHTQMHLVKAMKALDTQDLTLRSEANKRLSKDIDTEAVRAFLLQSLDLKAEPARWKLNLDVLEAEMNKILSFPEVDAVFDRPALFVYGGASDYLTDDGRKKIDTLFPQAEFSKIDGAGHWLHAEKPREFEAVVQEFITG